MNRLALGLVLCVAVASWGIESHGAPADPPKVAPVPPTLSVALPANPNIDMDGLKISQEAAKHRQTRLSEDDFIKMAAEKGTIVLDARSKEKYDLLHIHGAINMSFPDIAIDSLKKTLPDKDARILIYCNNNFKNAEQPFPSKGRVASLNLSTYISLYSYGYRNIYELAPTIDPAKSKLTFESTPKTK